MAINISGKFKPNGEFALVDAEDIAYKNGRLPDFLPVILSQDEYDALVASGEINETTLYLIRQEQ